MLTNNFKNWATSVLNANKPFYNMTDINGNAFSSISPNYSEGGRYFGKGFGAYSLEELISTECSSIFVGTGQREETLEDIALESLIADSELELISAVKEFNNNKFYFTKTFKYIGTSAITISEAALYMSIQTYGHSKSTPFCFARQLIEPIPVKTGDTFTVTMVIG